MKHLAATCILAAAFATVSAAVPSRLPNTVSRNDAQQLRPAPAQIKSTDSNPDDKKINLLSQSFASLKEGSESNPVDIACVRGEIPASLLGEKGYGGEGLAQAGGALYVRYGDETGFVYTPTFTCDDPIMVTVSLRSIIGEFPDDIINVALVDAKNYTLIDHSYDFVDDEWGNYTFTLDAPSGSAFLQIQADEYDFIVKDLVVTTVKHAVAAPVALPYADFTGDSFVARWLPVEGATSYLLTVREWDDEALKVTDVLLLDHEVNGTEFTVDGVSSGSIYYYQVQAFDGRNVSLPSNEIKVAALPCPQNVKARVNDDRDAIEVSWDEVYAANLYDLSINSNVKAATNGSYAIVDADFADLYSTGTLYQPEDRDEYYTSPEQMPTWTFVLPLYIKGAIGVEYGYLFEYYGFTAMIQSPIMNLGGATDGKVKIRMNAASSYENTFEAVIATRNSTNGEYYVADSYTLDDDMTQDFTIYEFTLSGASDDCFVAIRPVPNEYGEADLYVTEFKAEIDMEAGASISVPTEHKTTATNSATVRMDIADSGTSYSATVKALQYTEDGVVRLTSESSSPVIASDPMGIATISADHDGTPVYYNLQGIRIDTPSPGTVAIKRQGTQSTKVLFNE